MPRVPTSAILTSTIRMASHAASPMSRGVNMVARRRPLARRSSVIAGSSAARRPSAIAAGVGSTSTAASPATSGIAPRLLATTGDPQAMASTTGSPNPSYSDG